MRVSWSLNETFEAYMKRPRAERVLLHDRLNVQIDRVYSEGSGPPNKQEVKQGF